MTPKSFAWMPVYVDEWLAIRLTPEQKGALMDLRAYAWTQDPPCTLPDDDEQLALISGLGERWTSAGRLLRKLFIPVVPSDEDPDRASLLSGRLVDPWLRMRWEEQMSKHLVRSAAGKKGGRPKANPDANGKQGIKQTPNQPKSIASVLPQNLSILSSTAVRTENLEESKQTPQQTESIAFPELEAAYFARLNERVDAWIGQNPADASDLEHQLRVRLGMPLGRELTGFPAQVLREALLDEVRERNGWPDSEQWIAQQRAADSLAEPAPELAEAS